MLGFRQLFDPTEMTMPASLVVKIRFVLAPLLVASAAFGAADDAGDALRRAASAGDVAKVKELLDAGTDVNAANSYGGTALAFACDRGQTAVVQLLLERGANVETRDTYYSSTPLEWAAGRGHAEIVRALLEKGAQGEADALLSSADSGHTEVVRVILGRGKVGSETLSDALSAARNGEHAEIVALLEASGVKPHPVVAVDPAVLASYEGAYESDELKVTVAAKEGKLIVTSERWTFAFAAADPVTFRAEEVPGLKVVFQVESGTVGGLTFHRGSTATTLKRQATP